VNRTSIFHATNNIQQNVITTAKLITKNETFLSQAHPHPNSTFPVDRTHMISELLRRQPNPETQTWLDTTLALGQDVEREGEKMTSEQWAELWEWADYQHNVKGNEIFAGQDLGESDEEDDEEEEEEEAEATIEEKGKGIGRFVESGGPAMPLEDILRYVHSGGIMPVGGPPPMI
jgi:hypothetical protein